MTGKKQNRGYQWLICLICGKYHQKIWFSSEELTKIVNELECCGQQQFVRA